jgi:hypothetical protein
VEAPEHQRRDDRRWPPYIRGYKPRSNRQAVLSREIQRRIEGSPALLAALVPASADTDSADLLQRADPPEPFERSGRHVDYGALQEESRRVGKLGEKLVVEYEQARLRREGRADLADVVRWVADADGDGLGYDVLSFEASGEVLHIEVKATALAAQTPFYLPSAELDFARRHAGSYALYRCPG